MVVAWGGEAGVALSFVPWNQVDPRPPLAFGLPCYLYASFYDRYNLDTIKEDYYIDPSLSIHRKITSLCLRALPLMS